MAEEALMDGEVDIDYGHAGTAVVSGRGTASTTAAAPEKAEARMEKSLKDVESRFRQTGKGSDFIALRAAQISKRK